MLLLVRTQSRDILNFMGKLHTIVYVEAARFEEARFLSHRNGVNTASLYVGNVSPLITI